MYIKFGSGKPRESLEIDDGVIIDIGDDGEILGIEILVFSKRNIDLNKIIYFPLKRLYQRL